MSINSKYYNEHSKDFIENTINCDMSVQYNFFEKYLNNPKTILDLGFGSGRDSLYFMNKGYTVYSLDPTEEFCKNGKRIGLKNVYQLTAQEMQFENLFDGIWACASLLHVPSKELNDVFKKCYKSLKNDGIMYCSFKYGEFEGERNGREFTDLNEELFNQYINNTGFKVLEYLITEDVRPDRNEKWLNVILKKD